MTFKDIIGQQQIVSHMKNAVKEDKISHAYIICGEKGSGKKLLANTFAAAILCEEHGSEPCMNCKSCKQLLSGNHPDVKYVTHEKMSTISVDDVRVQLNSDITIKPYQSKRKIYIIDEAEKMGAPAQNAILKTIEEPPEYAVIMLLVQNTGMLLQTILSRCVLLNVRPVDKIKTASLLMSDYGVSEHIAHLAAAFSDGIVGRAIAFAASSDFTELKDSVIGRLKNIESMNAGDMYITVRDWQEDKQRISERLSLLEMWYRDVLVVKSTDSTDNVLFKEEEAELYRQAEVFSMQSLVKKTEAVKEAGKRLKANCNPEATLMLLFMAMRKI